jgi:hypothetical protein
LTAPGYLQHFSNATVSIPAILDFEEAAVSRWANAHDRVVVQVPILER